MFLMPQNAPTASVHTAARPGVTRLLVLLLVCAVPILSTIAKDSIYLPQSNTAHFINIAAKMKAADAPAVVLTQPQIAEPVTTLELPRPEISIVRQDELEAPSVPRVSLTVCLQHRSPPFALA
jgi:hypothetical protein